MAPSWRQRGRAGGSEAGLGVCGYCGLAAQVVISRTVITLVCRVCGGTPAADVNFRGVRGVAWAMAEIGEYGPFCRDCGLANYRATSAVTLKRAWWGAISFFAGPYFLVTNLAAARKLPRVRATGSDREPLLPGKPLWRRSAMLGLLVPAFLVSLLVIPMTIAEEKAADPLASACLSASEQSQSMRLAPCDGFHHYKVMAIVASASQCPPEAPFPMVLDQQPGQPGDDRTFCLVRHGDWPLWNDPFAGFEGS